MEPFGLHSGSSIDSPPRTLNILQYDQPPFGSQSPPILHLRPPSSSPITPIPAGPASTISPTPLISTPVLPSGSDPLSEWVRRCKEEAENQVWLKIEAERSRRQSILQQLRHVVSLLRQVSSHLTVSSTIEDELALALESKTRIYDDEEERDTTTNGSQIVELIRDEESSSHVATSSMCQDMSSSSTTNAPSSDDDLSGGGAATSDFDFGTSRESDTSHETVDQNEQPQMGTMVLFGGSPSLRRGSPSYLGGRGRSNGFGGMGRGSYYQRQHDSACAGALVDGVAVAVAFAGDAMARRMAMSAEGMNGGPRSPLLLTYGPVAGNGQKSLAERQNELRRMKKGQQRKDKMTGVGRGKANEEGAMVLGKKKKKKLVYKPRAEKQSLKEIENLVRNLATLKLLATTTSSPSSSSMESISGIASPSRGRAFTFPFQSASSMTCSSVPSTSSAQQQPTCTPMPTSLEPSAPFRFPSDTNPSVAPGF